MSQCSPGPSGVTSTLLHTTLASQWIPSAHTRETKVQQSHWQEATQAHSALPWTVSGSAARGGKPSNSHSGLNQLSLRLARGGGLMG